MQRELTDKRALVLGLDAIGAGIARRFAREGAQLALLHDDPQVLEALLADLSSAGVRVVSHLIDWTHFDPAAVTQVVQELGGLDILVTNVLPDARQSSLETQSDRFFRESLQRVEVAAASMKAALPGLRDSGQGRIIHVGHRYGEGVNEHIGAYNTAAWSLVGLTRTAALDWGRYQIATNLLLPLADTPEFQYYHKQRAALLDLMTSQLPLQRLGDPVEDIGATALFLAGDACNFVNGEVIHGDGGQHIAGPVLNVGKFKAGVGG